MKFIAVILAAVAAVNAQACADAAAKIPACARTCLDAAVPKVGCAVGDYACSCKVSDALRTEALACIQAGCAADVFPTVKPASDALCACAVPAA